MLRSTRSTDIRFGLAIAGFTATTAPHFYFTNSMEINTETAGERESRCFELDEMARNARIGGAKTKR